MVQTINTKPAFKHKPLYEELVGEFCRRITVGRWPVGRALKTESMIASELGVSLGTVRKAFDRLEAMNLIDRTPGRGTIVRELHCSKRLASLMNIIDRNDEPVMGEVTIGGFIRQTASEVVAAELELAPNTEVLRIERWRSHRGRTFAFETAYIEMPRTSVPDPQALKGSASSFVVNGEIAVAKTEFARIVSVDEAATELLAVGPEAQALELRRTLRSFDDKPLEFCIAQCVLGRDLRYRTH